MASSADRYTAYDPNAPADEGPGAVGYVALVLAWAVPGLGHMMIGQKVRGVVFLVAIHGLFGLGLLLAGVRAINPPDQAIWTYTQYLAGWPMVVADKVEKNSRVELGDRAAGDPRSNEYIGRLGMQFRDEAPPGERVEERQVRAKKFIAAHPSFAADPKMQDLGAVYCGIAGMLNLLVMFDVLLRITGSTREEAAKKKQPVTGASPAAPATAGAGAPAAEGAKGAVVGEVTPGKPGAIYAPALAFVPLYDPLFALYPGMGSYWLWLVIPLVVVISVVYKGTRVESVKDLPKDAAVMTAQLLLVMGLAAVVLACGYWAYLHFAGPLIR